MADKRAYFKLDIGYLTNPKVAGVAAINPNAVLLHIASIAYSAQHLTDGVVPLALLLRLNGAGQEEVDLLFNAGLWRDTGSGSIEVHDYLEHQRSSEDAKRARIKAKDAADARWNASGMPPSMPRSMQSASESPMPREREEREKRESANADPRPDVEDVCDLLADLIESNGSKRPAITKRWRDSARLMLDADGRPLAEVKAVMRWSQDDNFWRSNVLSMPKFREKYDTLRLQSGRDATTKPKTGDEPYWSNW